MGSETVNSSLWIDFYFVSDLVLITAFSADRPRPPPPTPPSSLPFSSLVFLSLLLSSFLASQRETK